MRTRVRPAKTTSSVSDQIAYYDIACYDIDHYYILPRTLLTEANVYVFFEDVCDP
jgi:hypothetical protein